MNTKIQVPLCYLYIILELAHDLGILSDEKIPEYGQATILENFLLAYIEEECLGEQVIDIKLLSIYITRLLDLIDSGSDTPFIDTSSNFT